MTWNLMYKQVSQRPFSVHFIDFYLQFFKNFVYILPKSSNDPLS